MGTGDVACQRIAASVDDVEWFEAGRTLRFATCGLLVMGPMSHTLEHALERHIPGTTARAVRRESVDNKQ
jgi:hypothetical protein